MITALAAGGVTYAHADKDVILTVDNRTQKVSAIAWTVEGLLESQGITVSSRDIVAPAPSTRLHDGSRVVVRYARPFTVTVDGVVKQYWTTELTVENALHALGIRADGSRLTASRAARIGRDGMTLGLATPKEITLTVAGRSRTVTTTAVTVDDLLAAFGVEVGADDRLSHPPASRITDGMRLRVSRVVTSRVTRTETIDAPSRTRTTSKLYRGQSRVVTAGRDGERVAVYEVTKVDGKTEHRRLVTSDVRRKPVTRVVEVGTAVRPAASGSGSGSSGSSGSGSSGGSVGGSVDSLNWPALARCESGGNPRIVSSNGLYHGLYQFSVSTWRSVGGSGLPSQASSSEQTYRAKLLYKRSGAGPWPSCGRLLFT